MSASNDAPAFLLPLDKASAVDAILSSMACVESSSQSRPRLTTPCVSSFKASNFHFGVMVACRCPALEVDPTPAPNLERQRHLTMVESVR